MKILIIRLSSIGDIVLTSPVVRCLKEQRADAELHFLCKESMLPVVENNPYLSKIHLLRKHDLQLLPVLQSEEYDAVIDLQRNSLSHKIVRQLGKKRHTFPKLNFRKFLLVAFKWNTMPQCHIVDRYFEAVKFMGVHNDGEGLDFFVRDEECQKFEVFNPPLHYVAVAVGSRHATKCIPVSKIRAIMSESKLPFVFLGDESDALIVTDLCKEYPMSLNLCGKLSLQGSAAAVSRADFVLTGDTGLMHIASALQKVTISLWGNTVPEFGMYPYQPKHPENIYIIENKKLFCRPCSKLGYKRCPLGHFKCMQTLSAQTVIDIINGKRQ